MYVCVYTYTYMCACSLQVRAADEADAEGVQAGPAVRYIIPI